MTLKFNSGMEYLVESCYTESVLRTWWHLYQNVSTIISQKTPTVCCCFVWRI